MSKSQPQEGFQRFEHRHGLATQWGAVGGPRGIKRQGDAGKLAADQFWLLQNVRLLPTQVVSRGGSSKVNSIAESGCITGIFDAGE